MRYIRYAFLIIVALCLITVALANRQLVLLQLMPSDLAELVGLTGSINLPLFLVIFSGVLAGLMLGFVWEYLREYKHRAALGQQGREVTKLEREVKRLKELTGEGKDDVLALIE
jgi:uncharacterized integral membrane protein